MADTYTQQKTYIDTNVNTNGVSSITGAIANTALVSYLLKNQPSLAYDTTRPYFTDQLTVKSGALYLCNTAHGPGAWDSSKWDKLTANYFKDTYTIANTGSQTFAHSLGVVPSGIFAMTATGANIVLNITASDESNFTVYSLDEYVDCIITLIA